MTASKAELMNKVMPCLGSQQIAGPLCSDLLTQEAGHHLVQRAARLWDNAGQRLDWIQRDTAMHLCQTGDPNDLLTCISQ